MRLSRRGLATVGAAFAAGLLAGGVVWRQGMDDPPVAEQSVAAANFVHIGIAVVVAATMYIGRRHLRTVLLGPVSEPWWRAVTSSLRPRPLSPLRVPGLVFRLALLVVLLFAPFRAGMQVLAGLNGNEVVNAWGGPTYLGAALVHWMDSALVFYLCAWLLWRFSPSRAFWGHSRDASA